MTNVLWDMLLCEHGAVALAVRENRLIRVCFKISPEDVSATIQRLHPGAKRTNQPLLQDGLRQLTEYFIGQRQLFAMQFDNDGLSAFACDVHRELIKVPYGTLVSYGELAARVGSPGAARAVGRVMSSNPFPLLVPCHRVVHADGRVGQYSAAQGPVTKAWLIDFERKRLSKENNFKSLLGY